MSLYVSHVSHVSGQFGRQAGDSKPRGPSQFTRPAVTCSELKLGNVVGNLYSNLTESCQKALR